MASSVVVTAYGAAALNALAEAVADAKRADPMARVTVFAPNNLAGIVARRHLARGRGIGGIEVTTLARLAERIAAPGLAPRRPATRPVLAAAWRRELAETPRIFEDIATHPSTVQALAQAHTHLRDLSADGLAAVGAATTLGADLVVLHRSVSEGLRGGWYDRADLLAAAAAQIRDGAELGACVLYLPQALTRAETAFAAAIAAAAGLTVVAALTGVRRADAAVERSLDALGLPGDGASASPPVAARVLTASDSDDEVRCVVREVVATLATTPAHRVAVLYAARAPYARLLHEHLGAAGVTVNGPGVRPVEERGVARALLELLALADRDVPRAELFQALANAPARDFGGERISVSRWERTSRSAGVVAGDDWANRLDAYAAERDAEAAAEAESDDPRPWLVERLGRDAGVARALGEFACRLREELRRAAAMTRWDDLAGWCLGLLTTLLAADDALRTLPPEEQHAAATVVTLLRGLAGLDTVDDGASFASLRDALALELAATLPRVGRFGEGVLVAPVTSAIGLDLDTVFVCGLSEDLYPGRTGADALLPERARQATGGELPSIRERIDARHRALLAAFGSAGVEAVASFPRGDLRRSTLRLPSRFLLPSLRRLSGDKNLAATEWQKHQDAADVVSAGSFAGELLRTDRLATEQEWRTRLAAADGRLDDPAVTAAVALIRARASDEFTRYDGNLAGVTGLPDYAVGDRAISPTALEGYAKCPHAFFVERLLGVKPLEQPEDVVVIMPTQIGNLVHQSVEELVTEFADELPGYGEPWTPAQHARLVQIVEAKAAEFERRGLTGHPRLWAVERARIVNDALWLLDDDDAWRAERRAAVRASELAFGMKGNPPVEIPVPGGRVLMRGSADKIDVGADGTVYVTDIKTGSTRSFVGITSVDPMAAGTKLQLPAYAYAARARFGTSTTPVHTMYWFVRSDRGRLGLDFTPDLERTYAETIAVLVGSIARGQFPARAPEAADFGWVRCPYCNPDGIGHADKREQWERKRSAPALRSLVELVEPAALAADGADATEAAYGDDANGGGE